MDVAGAMVRHMEEGVDGLGRGLQPGVLAHWYGRIISDAREMAPPWLQGKIAVHQDPVLPMKFRLDVSRRAVRYVSAAIEARLGAMPYSTRLYFLRVQGIISEEMDRSLV